ADDELAECLDHRAGRRGAVLAVEQDETRRGDVERQPVERDEQQDGGERGELERPAHVERDQQEQQRRAQVEHQAQVEHGRRQRDQQHAEDADHTRADGELAAKRGGGCELGGGYHRSARRRSSRYTYASTSATVWKSRSGTLRPTLTPRKRARAS